MLRSVAELSCRRIRTHCSADHHPAHRFQTQAEPLTVSPLRGAAVQQVPPQVTMVAAELEAKMVLFNVVEEVLASTGLKPCQARSYGSSIRVVAPFQVFTK